MVLWEQGPDGTPVPEQASEQEKNTGFAFLSVFMKFH